MDLLRKNKPRSTIGNIFIGLGIIYLVAHMFIVVADPITGITTDIWGLVIHEPPVWTSFIPGIGYVIEMVYSAFSLHGLVGVIVFVFLMYLGLLIKGDS